VECRRFTEGRQVTAANVKVDADPELDEDRIVFPGERQMKLVAFILALAMSASSAPVQDSSIDVPTILSDTQGYDFARYMTALITRVRYNWYSIMPEVARKGEKGRAVVVFTIVRDGKVQDLRLLASSGNRVLDRAATGAIQISSPFAVLPSEFKGDRITLQLPFEYN
jgi:TonB family protein